MSATPRTDLAQFAGIPEMGSGSRFVVEADFARQLERELHAALICAGVASKERGEWAVERDELRSLCVNMAASLVECAIFLEGKAHLFRAHNVFDDAQEYSDLAGRMRKTLAELESGNSRGEPPAEIACRSIFNDYDKNEIESTPASVRMAWQVGAQLVADEAAAPVSAPSVMLVDGGSWDLRGKQAMKIEVVFDGNPKKMMWNKRDALGILMNMFTPPKSGIWIATGHDGTILDRNDPVGDQVADGQRIYISRQAGTAA